MTNIERGALMTNKKAMLVISFGSTFDDTRTKDIGGIEQAMAAAFPAYDQYRAFTSNIIRKRLGERGIMVDDADTALAKLAAAGYTEVLVQPTHLLHGEEFEQKVLALKEKYAASFAKFIISKPLITDDADYPLVAAALIAQLPALEEGEGVVLMGHGSPRNNNKSFGRTYVKLQEIFDSMGCPVVLGTVEEDDVPNFEAVLELLKERKYSKVHMFPLMVVAGDHANNDMYSDEEDSWKTAIEALGISTEGHLYGMGRNKSVQALYVHHMLEALSK